ncbi:3-hydroxy-3-methylglutaryl-coenzyme A reductase 2-like [Humulus lupulus]|uniref:3-hydroxy-3-methylglutaryl-coenzyme A reductase 2-like n=1 Tax=Humulus lupulus TaxID=3486 RepID=UPI002B404F9D|nr:3-hydroxy-3-methylglutaryl-coenzyme A reductase 2-like [Humulus lupulus]
MPVGYVQIPVGIAGPLLLDGFEYSVPMETTEGCLIASTNRGCKAIHLSGGATSVLLRDDMTRAPVVRFNSAKRASELKFFLEDPENFETLSIIFNSGYAWLEVLTGWSTARGDC